LGVVLVVLINSDLHVHTLYSDGCISLDDLIVLALKNKLNLVTKADHNTINGNSSLKIRAHKRGLLFIPSVEISALESHVLAINCHKFYKSWAGKSTQELVEILNDENIIAILCHPYWRTKFNLIHIVKGFKGIEIMNHTSPIGSMSVLREIIHFPEIYDPICQFANSDSHSGSAYGKYQNFIQCDDFTSDSVLESIHKQRVRCSGQNVLKSMFLLLKDGKENALFKLRRKQLEDVRNMAASAVVDIQSESKFQKS
jgi:hypothetical protein